MNKISKILEKFFLSIALFFLFWVPGFFMFANQYTSHKIEYFAIFIAWLLLIIIALLFAIYFKKNE